MYGSKSYRSWTKYNITETGRILLPNNMSEVNDYICAPLKRRGYLCNECTPGHGPSIIVSMCTDNVCHPCTNDLIGIFKYLCLVFIPITVFYIVVVVLRLKMATASTTCFIMYCQLIVFAFNKSCDNSLLSKIEYQKSGTARTVTKAFLTIYGVFNLDFFRNAVPPFCVSSKLKPIHIALLDYVSAFYPFLLVFLTYLFINVHDCNFRPAVILWKPFHKCSFKVRKWLNTKSDVADVFSSFFLLSYTKIMYQTLILLNTYRIHNYSLSKYRSYYSYVLSADMSISLGSVNYITITVITLLIFGMFNILPTLLLTLYPTKIVRALLSKCTPRMAIIINTFVQKFHHCYRDGLDGGKDLRCFSGLYFFLRTVIVLAALALKSALAFEDWFVRGMTFSLCAVLVAVCKPYKNSYANIADALLLMHLAGICHVLSANIELKFFVPLMQAIILFPLIVFLSTFLINFWWKSHNSLITSIVCLKAAVSNALSAPAQQALPSYGSINN